MTRLLNCVKWVGAALALLISPAIVAFGAPFAVGIVGDVAASAWLSPIALALAGAIAINAWRRGPSQAAKSMT